MSEPALRLDRADSGDVNVAKALLAVGADDAHAVVVGTEALTYGQLRAAVERLAGILAARSSAGARVALVAENGPFFVVAYLATIRAGLCVVPLPTGVQRDWTSGVLAAIDCELLLASERCARDPDLSSAASERGVAIWSPEQGSVPVQRSDDEGRGVPHATGPDDLAALMFTSGSTGDPKGVMVSHRNISANTRDIVDYMSLTASDRAMLVLPLHYCYGLSVLHSHLAAGGSIVCNNSFMFPEKVLDDMKGQGCTGFAGVPSHYQILLRRTRFADREFPALRWLQQAGGKLPDAFLRDLRAAHPGVQVFVMYGQTEATARLSYLPPRRLDDKLGSIGRGLPSTILEVLDDDGNPVTPGSGCVGEIVATGDNVAVGYWRDPETSARYFDGGRLHTRDLATVDEDGFIFIADRARDFIKSMGNRVSPKEIEDVVAELTGVVEVAVVGLSDDVWGEAICAVVVPVDESITADVVRDHCNARLPNYKVPTRVEVVSELPRNEAGKVLKPAVRELLTEAVDGS